MSTDMQLDQKRTMVTDKMKKRDVGRIAENQKRSTVKEDKVVQEETLEYFLKHFADKGTSINEQLEQAHAIEARSLVEHFDIIQKEFHSLQKLTTDSSFYIPSFQLQKAQSTLSTLQITILDTRSKLIPKKKFALKSRTKLSAQVPDAPVAEPVKVNTPVNQDNECNIAECENQTITKHTSELCNKDVSIRELKNCKVMLQGSPSALHINQLHECQIFSGPVSGSIFIDNCKNCTFVLPCQQLRIHSTTNTSFYIHVTSRAIIEDSQVLLFAPYNWSYSTLEKDYKLSGLDKSRNTWNDVDDFNWLASDTHSPNWAVMPEDQRKNWSH